MRRSFAVLDSLQASSNPNLMMLPSYDFDIDAYLNPFIPRNRLHLLPKSISRFLGYRSAPEKSVGSVLVWFWSFIGAVCGILVVEAVFRTPLLKSNGAPIVIGSLGASAILKYNTISSPLSQPRNAILGQLLSSLIGVSITKLFQLLPPSKFESLRFVGGALAVGLASAVMGITKTVHPPAGATALMAVTSNEVMELGWHLVPLILLGSVLMVAVACVINNLQRTYPLHWWTATELKLSRDREVDVEKVAEEGEVSEIEGGGRDLILINGSDISVPEWLCLDEEETAVLDMLRKRLERRLEVLSSSGSQATFVGEPAKRKGSEV